jgi:hypothetical protein
MKITSRILSLFLSEMKPDDISIELIFINVFFKAQWVLLVALLSNMVKVFPCMGAGSANYGHSRRFTLCHEI